MSDTDGFPRGKLTAKDLAERLAERAEEVCRQYLPGGRRSGQYWHAGDVGGGPGRSLYVHLSGGKAGRWEDQATGQRGDLLDLIRLARGLPSAGDAMDEAARFLGLGGEAGGKGKGRAVREERHRALYAEGRPITGEDPVGRYLAGRGLPHGDAGDCLFHPAVPVNLDGGIERRPALLAPIRAPGGELEAVQRIFVTEDGRAAPFGGRRRLTGSPRNGGVWFGSPNPAAVAICEGVEDALAVTAVLTPEERETVAVVAAVSAGRVGAVDLPPGVGSVVLVQDNDAAGETAWLGLLERWGDTGTVPVRVVPSGTKDANDELRTNGPDALRALVLPALMGAAEPEPAAGTPAEGAVPASEPTAAGDGGGGAQEEPDAEAAGTAAGDGAGENAGPADAGASRTKKLWKRLNRHWKEALETAERMDIRVWHTPSYWKVYKLALKLIECGGHPEGDRKWLSQLMAAHNTWAAGWEEVQDYYKWLGRVKDRRLMLTDIGVPMTRSPRYAELRKDEEALLRRTKVLSVSEYHGPHIDYISNGRDWVNYALVSIPIWHRRDAAGLA